MALKGKIDDFGIAEIFQLISQQQRSGVLTINSGEKTAEIIFVNGLIYKARPYYSSPKNDPFGAAVLNALLVNEAGLQRALQQQEVSLKDLDEVFFDINLLNYSQIQKLNETLDFETLYDTFQWKSGDYEFNLKDIEPHERFARLIPAEQILLDVLRMIDEEPELAEQIPHYGIVFQKTSGEKIFVKLPDSMGSHENLVYSLVDGIRTTQNIINQSMLGRYNTTKALANLFEGKDIKKISTGKIVSPKPLLKKNPLEYVTYGVLPVVIILFCLGIRIVFFPSTGIVNDTYKIALAKTQSQKINNALHVFFLKKGNFPKSLDELVKEGLICSEDLNYPRGVKYNYHLLEDGAYKLG